MRPLARQKPASWWLRPSAQSAARSMRPSISNTLAIRPARLCACSLAVPIIALAFAERMRRTSLLIVTPASVVRARFARFRGCLAFSQGFGLFGIRCSHDERTQRERRAFDACRVLTQLCSKAWQVLRCGLGPSNLISHKGKSYHLLGLVFLNPHRPFPSA